jgi:hypothetical protein
MNAICNFRYARSRRGGGSFPDVKGLLKYIQFRDDRVDHIPGAGGPNRWVDGGLGSTYQEILSRLDQLSPGNRSAYCFSVVISPDPGTMANVQGDRQARFVQAIQATIQEWESWRQEHDKKPHAGRIEYSLVVHRPERNYGEQMHAHLILPAATQHPVLEDMTPLYNNRPHMDAFKKITYRQLDRAYGLDREQDRAALEQEEEPETLDGAIPEREIEFFRLFETQPVEEGMEAGT